ncbi:hypothetical protein AB0A73_29130 [Glycomyces sp. NPDC047369]
MVTGEPKVRVVGEPREEIDIASIAAILVDAALLIAEDDPAAARPACQTDEHDRKADGA